MSPRGIEHQPVSQVQWVERESLRANAYNPNTVFRPELALLKLSLLEDGWTQPIVARPDGEIVDGFHRWTLSAHPELHAMTNGRVPVVFLKGKTASEQRISTIRHNRARGQHGVLKMSKILRDLVEAGVPPQRIESALGMETEEVDRLTDVRSSPDHAGKESFGQGWVPDGSRLPQAAK